MDVLKEGDTNLYLLGMEYKKHIFLFFCEKKTKQNSKTIGQIRLCQI